jgi:hypothetical protein
MYYLFSSKIEGTPMHKPKQQIPGSMILFCSVIVGGLFSPQATAADVSHGEIAAAMRSAHYPCDQVLEVDSDGDNAWVVQCNSGKFNVSRDQNGNFKVSKTD